MTRSCIAHAARLSCRLCPEADGDPAVVFVSLAIALVAQR